MTDTAREGESRKLTVLVLGVGGNVSQGILKALAKSSVPTRVLGADISAFQMGLYTVDKAFVSPWANDPAFVPWLIETCRNEGVDAILCGVEPVLVELSNHRDAIQEATGAQCLVNTPETLRIGDDKFLGCQWLEKHGFRTPRYARAEDETGVRALVAACGYPLIAKPRVGGGARGLFEVTGEQALLSALGRDNYLLQEYVGTMDAEYTVGCFCGRGGGVRGSIVMRRELLMGTSVRVEVGAFPEVREEAEAIAEALGVVGPCNIQLRVDKDGPVCFEINPRFSGTTPMRAHFGFNEAEWALRHFVLGEEAVNLPLVTEGIALRYWNEVYVDPIACETLARDRVLNNSSSAGWIEDFGVSK